MPAGLMLVFDGLLKASNGAFITTVKFTGVCAVTVAVNINVAAIMVYFMLPK